VRAESSVARNATANVLQMLIGATLLFVLYHYINKSLGVDKLGVWSVVLATASASRLADLGLSAGVTRFVARNLALALPGKAAQVVETAVLSLSALLALILVGMYPFLGKLLPYLFDKEYLPQALDLVPYALVSLWMTMVASVAQSGLDGCQRMVPRAVLVVLGQGLMVVIAFALVPKFGLLGLAWAQIGQGVFLMVVGWLMLRRHLRKLSFAPWRWHPAAFREMLSYGANVQVANVLMLLFDPLTKALMAKFGGPTNAGYFEIANQVVLRARALIVAANQAIVPRIAHLLENDAVQLPLLYCGNMRLLVLVALPSYTLLFAWGGMLSQMIIGTEQAQFIFLLQICALAWLVNTFASPAYFVNMGTGSVGLNTLSHVAMGILNLVLGLVLGEGYGAGGVAWSYAIALIFGSMLLITVFQMRHTILWRELLLVEHLPLLCVCLLVSLYSTTGHDFIKLRLSNYQSWSIAVLFPLFLVSAAVWIHPLRGILWRRSSVIPTPMLGK
jgi:O-antigen/teichoic acid export membrane protein